MGKNFTAFFFILFLNVSLLVTLAGFPLAVQSGSILKGEWAKDFEKALGEKSLIFAPSRDFWGRIDKSRKEAVLGENGNIYTAEEFLTSRQDEKNYQENVKFIEEVKLSLVNENIRLLIAVIPSKARTLEVINLPQKKRELPERLIKDLKKSGIELVMLSNIDFLKTDTHWSPEGSEVAAKQIANALPQGTEKFTNNLIGSKDYKGDLHKFISAPLSPEKLKIYEMEGGQPQDLFADENIPVVLVGTSYSAKAEFNFENFLKEYLKQDVLNLSDQGRGPFAVMKDYLAQKNYNPEIVIWEIPERYLTMHLE